MTNFFKTLGLGALMVTGILASDASAQEAKRLAPVGAQYYVGIPRVSVSPIMKTGPTIVPVVDSNAILNLDYQEIRSTPKVVAKPAPVKPIVKEATLAELKVQLRTAEDELKAAKLAYTQAVRSKDNARVEAAKVTRTAAQAKVTDLKKQIAAKQPAVRKTAKKKTGGVAKQATAATKQ